MEISQPLLKQLKLLGFQKDPKRPVNYTDVVLWFYQKKKLVIEVKAVVSKEGVIQKGLFGRVMALDKNLYADVMPNPSMNEDYIHVLLVSISAAISFAKNEIVREVEDDSDIDGGGASDK